jgi:hypothetical protein
VDEDTSALLKAAATGDPAHALLVAAAVVSAQRRAGALPPTNDTPITAAPDETLPPCPVGLWKRITPLLKHPQRYHALACEWMERAAAKGWRVPHLRLVLLFEFATQHKGDARTRWLVRQVMGERGKWLAAQDMRWTFLLEDSPETPPAMIDEAAALAALAQPDGFATAAALLKSGRWTPAVMNAFMEVLMRMVRAKNARHYYYLLPDFVPLFPPESLGALLDALEPLDDEERRLLPHFTDLIQFRRDMLAELARELDRDE